MEEGCFWKRGEIIGAEGEKYCWSGHDECIACVRIMSDV